MHRHYRRAAALTAEFLPHERLETIRRGVTAVEQIFDRLTGQIVSGELIEGGNVAKQAVERHFGAVHYGHLAFGA